jgi:hypothetical protein
MFSTVSDVIQAFPPGCDCEKHVKLPHQTCGQQAFGDYSKTLMEILLALYAFGGIFLAGLSVPLILYKIPPNGYYGFRVRSTYENPKLWYKANAYAGRRFLVVGLGTSVGSILLYFPTQPDVNRYALSCLGLFLALFLWGIITSFLYLRSIHEP